jgi:hypothetical protein
MKGVYILLLLLFMTCLCSAQQAILIDLDITNYNKDSAVNNLKNLVRSPEITTAYIFKTKKTNIYGKGSVERLIVDANGLDDLYRSISQFKEVRIIIINSLSEKEHPIVIDCQKINELKFLEFVYIQYDDKPQNKLALKKSNCTNLPYTIFYSKIIPN